MKGTELEHTDKRLERSDERADRLLSELRKTRILVEGLYPKIDALGEKIREVLEAVHRHIADPDAHRR